MTGSTVVAIVLSVVVVAMLLLRGTRVVRGSRALRAEGRPLPRTVYLFWALAAVAVVVLVIAWSNVLVD